MVYLLMVTPLLLQVDVMGCMHFWGLTIDVVSSVLVIVSTGLCVDFSVHIAHAFLTNQVCSLTRKFFNLRKNFFTVK